MTTAHGSHVSVTHKAKREKCISLLMLPPVFFSTASRTEKQSGKEKRTLAICQIKTVDKKANREFPDKIVLGVVGWGGEGSFAYKSIYWVDFEILIVSALSNLTIAVQFLAERKRR